MRHCIFCGKSEQIADIRCLSLAVCFHSYLGQYRNHIKWGPFRGRTVWLLLLSSGKGVTAKETIRNLASSLAHTLPSFDREHTAKEGSGLDYLWLETYPWRFIHRIYPVCFSCMESIPVKITEVGSQDIIRTKGAVEGAQRFVDLYTDLISVYESLSPSFPYTEAGDISFYERLRFMTLLTPVIDSKEESSNF